MREDAYRGILSNRILKLTDKYTKEELEKKTIDEIEMILYDHKESTYISDDELKAYETE